MEISWGRALWRNFLGQSPDWYKLALIIFLIVNPLIFLISPFVAGWLLVAEFIFTLAVIPDTFNNVLFRETRRALRLNDHSEISITQQNKVGLIIPEG